MAPGRNLRNVLEKTSITVTQFTPILQLSTEILSLMLLAAAIELYLHVVDWYECVWLGKTVPSGRIQDLPFGLLLKIASPDGASEADTLRFVRAHTTIPVPRVIASAEGFGRRYTIMTCVEGQNLELIWKELKPLQRTKIIGQLQSFTAQLRSLTTPHGPAVCALNGAALKDSRISSGTVGSFPDEDAFNEHLIEAAKPFMDESTLPGIRSRMRGDHAINFTHGDLARRNIMVKEGEIAAIIDWEESGWYPEHWEYVKAMYNPGIDKDQSWVDQVRSIFPQEYETDWLVDRELSDHMYGAF
ncbi:kinase-like protein [Amylostereum chailletii]|nr:kinase-like protein [Amylostereum chailletii]